MPIDLAKIRQQTRVTSITVSHVVHSGRKTQDFVSMTIKCEDEEGWSSEEAHIAHKLLSRDCMEMAYMDALSNGHKSKNQVRNELSKRRRNYSLLIRALEHKYNKAEPVSTAEAA